MLPIAGFPLLQETAPGGVENDLGIFGENPANDRAVQNALPGADLPEDGPVEPFLTGEPETALGFRIPLKFGELDLSHWQALYDSRLHPLVAPHQRAQP